MKVFCMVLLLGLCFTAQAEIKRFYRVNEGIYRGTQPKKEDFPKLAQMGIRTVLDLRGGRIHKPRERRRVEAAGMRYVSIRLSGIFPPKNWQIAQVLAVKGGFIDPLEAISFNGPISLKKLTRQTVRKIEAKIILNALHANNWNRKKAARSLDISYRALLYKLKDVGIPTRRSLSAPKHSEDKAQG